MSVHIFHEAYYSYQTPHVADFDHVGGCQDFSAHLVENTLRRMNFAGPTNYSSEYPV